MTQNSDRQELIADATADQQDTEGHGRFGLFLDDEKPAETTAERRRALPVTDDDTKGHLRIRP